MPCGIGSQFNLEYSTLLDAYKKSELLPDTGLGLFRLSAIPVDRPEPAEALRTTVAWSVGLKRKVTLLSSVQLDRFRQGKPLRPETDVRAERGAYFVQSELRLRPGQRADWLLVADVNQGPAEVAQLNQLAPQTGAVAKARSARCPARHRGTAAHRRERRWPAADRAPAGLRAALQQHAVQHHARRRFRRRLRGGFARPAGVRAECEHGTRRASRRVLPPPAEGAALSSVGCGRARGRRPAARTRLPRIPSAHLQPPSRRPEPALESLLHHDPQRRRHAQPELRGQLARHLPELGGARGLVPRLHVRDDLPLSQRLDRRRLQSLSHHAQRHRLGGRGPARPVVLHRLLGRSPDHLPAETAGAARAP